MEEGADDREKVQAFLKPRVIQEFIGKYDGSPVPREDIAVNVLSDMGVPKERGAEVLGHIIDGEEELGLVSEIKGKKFINLSNTKTPSTNKPTTGIDDGKDGLEESIGETSKIEPLREQNDGESGAVTSVELKERAKKVFITHGKNKDFIESIKKLLSFGELTAVVSVEKQSVSKPVPEKVMQDMRSCGAAIIHVEDELKLIDSDANEHVILNPNVLIEIGAAMALYDRRFILLVKNGVNLTSNLQGLFEVRYEGTALDGNATIRLLEAINELKKEPL
ncbi:MAG: TIR domain-containing protein [Paracoccaceae bacterium]